MLLDPAEVAVIFPAQTRYEQRGGGTETSTERRIYFSPEIPGRRVGESKSEWEIFMELAERVDPEKRRLIHFDDGGQVRDEIAKAVPFYDGIQHLRKKGDVVQWGGTRLCDGGQFKLPEGRARFVPLEPPETQVPDGWFYLTTRRGKQFNSIVQADQDPLTGAARDHVFMSQADAERLGLREGDPVLLTSEVGQLPGRCKIAPIKPGNVQVHWPEGNVLIRRGVCDPVCGIPDYNAIVQVVPRSFSVKDDGSSLQSNLR
jgi:predicted molibdopterin-dependent oxidoreductase YjgC